MCACEHLHFCTLLGLQMRVCGCECARKDLLQEHVCTKEILHEYVVLVCKHMCIAVTFAPVCAFRCICAQALCDRGAPIHVRPKQ